MLNINVVYGKKFANATAISKCMINDVTDIFMGELSYRDAHGFGCTVMGIELKATDIHETKFRYEGKEKRRVQYEETGKTYALIPAESVVTIHSTVDKKQSWRIKNWTELKVLLNQLETLINIENIKE